MPMTAPTTPEITEAAIDGFIDCGAARLRGRGRQGSGCPQEGRQSRAVNKFLNAAQLIMRNAEL
jgi:hypothetical protein